MKYQVNVSYTWDGEFSVEADSPEEAWEFVKDDTFSDPWSDASGNHTIELNEVYEWDEAAQERQRKQNEEVLNKYVKDLL
jgi:hypothetical protein